MITYFKNQIFGAIANADIDPNYVETVGHIILLLIALCISWLVGYICRRVFSPLILKLVTNTKFIWDDYFLNKPVVKAFCRIIPGLTFYTLLPFCLPDEKELVYTIITQATKIYIAVTFISLTTAFLNNIENFTVSDEKLKDKQLYGTIEFLKIVAYFIGGIIIISYLIGKSPLSMIAGIGAAATVLMLVFKDSILGLVAGIQLSTNKMLKPGDWITIKNLNIDGVVEQVSLTTVKIRNFDNTIATVPPYYLISNSFQNWAPMKSSSGRRVKRAINIDVNSIQFADNILLETLRKKKYITNADEIDKETEIVNLTLFRKYIEFYLRNLSNVNNNATILVRQLEPTTNGLPLEIYYFSSETSFIEYEQLAAETMEYIIAILPIFGLRMFQAPTGNDIRTISCK